MKNRLCDYITSAEAAKLLGFTPDYIRKMISQGKIKATKMGNSWVFMPKDIKHIKRVRHNKE